jgi:hypothetical protein
LAATIRASVGASSAFAVGACPSAHRTRVAVAVRRSLGFVCCHTAIDMLAWLLHPQSVYDRRISRRDCFGINFEECWHVRFDSRDLLPTAQRFFRVAHRRAADPR